MIRLLVNSLFLATACVVFSQDQSFYPMCDDDYSTKEGKSDFLQTSKHFALIMILFIFYHIG